MKIWSKMLFLGDSLTHGSRDPYRMSFPYYFSHLIWDKFKVVIIPEVEAKPGRISAELLQAGIPAILKSEAMEVVILIGTNDTKPFIKTPASILSSNIGLLINVALCMNKSVFVLTIPLPKGFGAPDYVSSMNSAIKDYNAGIRFLMQSMEISDHLVECEDVSYTEDGIHFSVKSNQEIARRLCQTVMNVRNFI